MTSAVSTVGEMVSEVFTMITSNPLLCVFVAASLIGVGIAVFRKIKGASGGN